MKIKAAKRRYLKPLEFYQFHLDTETVPLTSTITFLEKDTLTANPIWRSRAFASEKIITQNIQRKERERLIYNVVSPKGSLQRDQKQRKNWFHDGKVTLSVLVLTEWTAIINIIYINCLEVCHSIGYKTGWYTIMLNRSAGSWYDHLVCCVFVHTSLCSPSRCMSVCLSHTHTPPH